MILEPIQTFSPTYYYNLPISLNILPVFIWHTYYVTLVLDKI